MEKKMIQTTYTQARQNFAKLCDKVANTLEIVKITRRNGGNVALISETELNSLLETMHLLKSPKNAEHLRSALRESSEGMKHYSSIEEIKQEYGIEDE